MDKAEFLKMLLTYIPGFRDWMKQNHPNELPKEVNDMFGGNYGDLFEQIMKGGK